jgi:hypothetical protein
MKLTATAVKNAKPGRHSDGEGMYLLVTEAGQKYWRFDYRFLGKYKTLALGVFPDTTLAMARSKRAEARTLLASNQDPSVAKRKAKEIAKQKYDNNICLLNWGNASRTLKGISGLCSITLVRLEGGRS